jgi:putative phosphoesterase
VKVAIIADVHGNADAMQAVAAAFRVCNVEKVIVAGDIVGYYYHPDRVLALLSEWDCVTIRGNHEDMLAAWLAGKGREDLVSRFGSGLDSATRCLSVRQMEELIGLPTTKAIEIEGCRVLICHGSPWDHDAYIYPDADASIRRRLFDGTHDVVVFGHTHYPVLWSEQGRLAVNPGSIGQPRDRIPGACWALWDTDSGQIDLRRETYDAGGLVIECRTHDPHLSFIADVLTRR